jgi:hypothetical protein
MQTGKSRDLNAAIRQLTQPLRNDRWLGEKAQPGRKPKAPARRSFQAVRINGRQNKAGPSSRRGPSRASAHSAPRFPRYSSLNIASGSRAEGSRIGTTRQPQTTDRQGGRSYNSGGLALGDRAHPPAKVADKGHDWRAEVGASKRIPTNTALFARHREISVCMGLRGGAGRTRTSHQLIISRQLCAVRVFKCVCKNALARGAEEKGRTQ